MDPEIRRQNFIYIKEGRIEQEFTSDEFKALSDLRREQMGLRSIIPEQIQIPEITVNSEDAVLQVCKPFQVRGRSR
mgnify:CR=1 FL=1